MRTHSRSILHLTVALAMATAVSVLTIAPSTAAPTDCFAGDFKLSVDASDVSAGATVVAYNGSGGSVAIPGVVVCSGQAYNVTTIGVQSFYNTAVTSVTIPNSVTVIKDSAFALSKLTSVTIPDSVITIEGGAFSSSDLTSATIGNSVTTIGDSAFSQNALDSVTIGSSVTAMGQYAFGYNTLTSVTIPNSVITIGDGAFTQNSLTSVTIGNSVTSIGENAFSANSLTSVTIPNSVTTIGLSAFFSNVDLASLTLGNSVTTIGPYAFSQGALSSVTIPDSVTLIDESAFSNNELTSIHLGNSVTTIGPWAFFNNLLSAVTIPASVTTIGGIAFAGNSYLSSVVFEGAAPTTITDGDDPTASLGQGNDPVVSYKDVFDASNVANGFTTPTWRGYATHKIDTSAPTVTINQGSGQADPTGTSPVLFDVVFSKDVTGFADNDVHLSGTANATTAHVTGSGKNYTVSVSGMTANGTVIADIPVGGATDGTSASAASTSTDNTVTFTGIDESTPSVTINQGAGQADPTGTSPIVYDVHFSESVTGFDDNDVHLSGTANATTAHVLGSGSNYIVSVSGMTSNGTVIADIPVGAATDGTNLSAASTSTDNTVTFTGIDTTAPTVTINQGANQADSTGTSPIVFDVVFSEPVTGFADNDVHLAGTANATTAHVTGSGATYTVSVSGMTANGTVIATVPIGAAADGGNNLSFDSTSTDNTVTFTGIDTTTPTVTINQGANQADSTGTSPIVFDVVFSEPVTGFGDNDVTLSGTANATTAHVTGSGSTYTVSVSGMTSSGTVIASIPVGAATDGTNLSAASTSTDNTVTYNGSVTGLNPTITGLAQVGQTLTAHEGPVSPSDAALSYVWKANGTPIVGATGSTYKLKAAQAGKIITVTITASKPPLTAQTETSDDTPYVRDKVDGPEIKLDRSNANRGGDLGLLGKGLVPGATYQVTIGGTSVGSFSADEYGEINRTVTVPAGTKTGIQIVTITAPNGKVSSTVVVIN